MFLLLHLSADTLLFVFLTIRPPPTSTLFPYTTLFRSSTSAGATRGSTDSRRRSIRARATPSSPPFAAMTALRSEEHTSELQSRVDLVCRLLLEKKKIRRIHRDEPAVVRRMLRPDRARM